MKQRILHLTLKRAPFEVMITGEKDLEYRTSSDWTKSRLFNKDGTERKYDAVKFTNGYGKDKPQFVAEFKGVQMCAWTEIIKFSNGLQIKVTPGMYIIEIGTVGLTRNISSLNIKACNSCGHILPLWFFENNSESCYIC